MLLALTAPVRAPGKTVSLLEREIGAMLRTGGAGEQQTIELYGNRAVLRLVRHAPLRGGGLLGFVHNPDVEAATILDLAERWLQAGE